jgi:hypothetical protein
LPTILNALDIFWTLIASNNEKKITDKLVQKPNTKEIQIENVDCIIIGISIPKNMTAL